MSFDYPQKPKRRAGGGCGGLLMLLVVGGVMFFFMNARGGGGPGQNEGVIDNEDRQSQRGVNPQEVDRQLREADEYRRQREDVLGSKKKPETEKAMPTGQTRRNSDWSIEDVDGPKKAESTEPSVKKTQGKDGWSIEDVPTKKKSDANFRLNKSDGGKVELKEKSDWSVEDVEPKAKKTTQGDWTVEEVEKGGGE